MSAAGAGGAVVCAGALAGYLIGDFAVDLIHEAVDRVLRGIERDHIDIHRNLLIQRVDAFLNEL